MGSRRKLRDGFNARAIILSAPLVLAACGGGGGFSLADGGIRGTGKSVGPVLPSH